eukprot:jgi/Botrbrau1/7542/Bobra.0019s0029.2
MSLPIWGWRWTMLLALLSSSTLYCFLTAPVDIMEASSSIKPSPKIRDISRSQGLFNHKGPGQNRLLRRLLASIDVLDHAKIEVFSAYHDPLLNEVRIFAAVHPGGVCQKFQRCVFPNITTSELEPGAETLMPFWSRKQMDHDFVDCYVTCRLNVEMKRRPESVTVLFKEEVVASTSLEPVIIGNVSKGIGMCLGPVYSYIPQFADWLMYHSALGVEGIHAYSPVLDPRQKKGRGFYRPPFLLHHFLLEWTLYRTPLHYAYFGQKLLYNDCIYRHRHLYQFIFIYDADEFIYFPSGIPSSLLTWLTNITPSNASAASLHCARYDAGCKNEFRFPRNAANGTKSDHPELYQSYNYSVFNIDFNPIEIIGCRTSDGFCTMKSIVRPLAIKAYNVHYPQAVYPGWEWLTFSVDPHVAIYKHIRCEWTDK